jgi:hypothetical protein
MRSAIRRLMHGALVVLAIAVPARVNAGAIVFSASGADATAIQAEVDAFRAILGDPNNANAPGPLAFGRREINWDGGGAATTVSPTPLTAFQGIRGATFTTPGTDLVQAPPSGLATEFANPTYANFDVFSAQRLFTPKGSNITDATFTIPGDPSFPALVSGFGAVFADVDLANLTTLQFFDEKGASLGIFSAAAANDGLSFLGVFFDAGENVARVRITTGNSAPGPNDGGAFDIVMIDDVLYSEPRPIPEPSTFVLAGLGALGVFGFCWRRRRRGQELRVN